MTTKKKPTRSVSRRKKAPASSFSKVRLLLWTALFGLTAGSLVLAMTLLKTMPYETSPKVPVSPGQSLTVRRELPAPVPRDMTPPTPRPAAKIRKKVHPYEEIPAESLEYKIREADMAILQAALQCGISSEGVRHTSVEQRESAGQEYHFQTITIAPSADLKKLGATLSTTLTTLVDGAVLTAPRGADRDLRITVDGFPTHRLVLGTIQAPSRQSPDSEAALAIVIDDMGRSVREGAFLADLDMPVSFSILPYNAHAREVAELAHRRGLEVLIHLPMEPRGYPETADPGPGALFTSMKRQTIRSLMVRALQRVPHASGANNHMGSRFTESGPGMDAVLSELAGHRLFFLDSVTTPRSQGENASRKARVPYIRRNIFLDNVQDAQAIIFQLKKAETLARRRGAAVAIGHPYPETLRALDEWSRTRDTSVRIRTVTDLLKKRG
ncbi:MAG TPA: divergent polysaccharide deacetylase family protein [Desulfomicrobiaceae bacterium]|nr:divergent polysaccharide deacetylase family protein [Desulfomicrobiaceae bacterium]